MTAPAKLEKLVHVCREHAGGWYRRHRKLSANWNADTNTLTMRTLRDILDGDRIELDDKNYAIEAKAVSEDGKWSAMRLREVSETADV